MAEISDDARTFQAFRMGAFAGNAEAQFDLASCYYYGYLGVQKDMRRSFEWWLKSAEQNHLGAMYNVAVSYYHGYGVPENAAMAKVWYKKCAAKGCAGANIALNIFY